MYSVLHEIFSQSSKQTWAKTWHYFGGGGRSNEVNIDVVFLHRTNPFSEKWTRGTKNNTAGKIKTLPAQITPNNSKKTAFSDYFHVAASFSFRWNFNKRQQKYRQQSKQKVLLEQGNKAGCSFLCKQEGCRTFSTINQEQQRDWQGHVIEFIIINKKFILTKIMSVLQGQIDWGIQFRCVLASVLVTLLFISKLYIYPSLLCGSCDWNGRRNPGRRHQVIRFGSCSQTMKKLYNFN